MSPPALRMSLCSTPPPPPPPLPSPPPSRATRTHVSNACALCRSITILSDLITDEMKAHPAWASWCKMVQLFSVVIQHKLSASDVERIDDLQLEHARLFNLVPDYYGRRRPKHHFLSHLAVDIWNWGPPRGFWCFGFESFNRVIKRGARRSNFKHEAMSCMRYWSLSSGRQLAM